MNAAEPKSLILFDGVCNLCNSAVNFIIDRDPEGRFEFAPLQSPLGESTLSEKGMTDASNLSTMVLVEDGRCFTRSTAALRIGRRLKFPWPLLYGMIIVPRFLRDWLYNRVAKNRYRWFGKHETCRMPTAELAARFRDTARQM
jgi:predicted DCC family thiol-disulfide oxidoreductase YuxK